MHQKAWGLVVVQRDWAYRLYSAFGTGLDVA
jgi:hypothetical protein